MAGKVLIISNNLDEGRKIGWDVSLAGFAVMGLLVDWDTVSDTISDETPDIIILDVRFSRQEQAHKSALFLEKEYNIPYLIISDGSFHNMSQMFSDLSAVGIINVLHDRSAIGNALQTFFSESRLHLRKRVIISDDNNQSEKNKSAVNIIGDAKVFKSALSLADQVAETSTTVLILGETGTGKEVFAKYIHQKSLRRDENFISLNCAAIPEHLIESELFGHEKGSFTGAIQKRVGKFQKADNGTVFLDEIGELSYNAQAKFLRFLQEQEIESIGGEKTEKLDVRVIAATNRNLKQQVQEGKFRSDLFYRLSAFPITIPALRDRKDDIRKLAYFFLEKSAERMGKQIHTISEATLSAFERYNWPGNVRELENVIERGVVVCASDTLEMYREDIHCNISSGQVSD